MNDQKVVYIVKGVGSHDTDNLKAFFDYHKALEWKNNYEGDGDYAFLTIGALVVIE